MRWSLSDPPPRSPVVHEPWLFAHLSQVPDLVDAGIIVLPPPDDGRPWWRAPVVSVRPVSVTLYCGEGWVGPFVGVVGEAITLHVTATVWGGE